ncbi:hypothetical protein [Microbacterium sp. ZW T5_56]|uniref:hypothetical protein n=1 Tax=Microbacterium sp. ZW T5_56 TaxID=3378081 RepID=UPI003851B19D
MSDVHEVEDRPEIVCICGSARFADVMRMVNRQLTFAGIIVLAPAEADGPVTDEQKTVLDALHLRKIDLADRVVVVCPDGYLGTSVQREVDYASAAGKSISYVGVVRVGEAAHVRRARTPRTAM